MGKLQFSMRPRIIQGDDLAGIYSSDDTCRIVYKNFYPQHTPVADYRVECILALNNFVQNEDLSIEFDYGGIKKVRAQTTWATSRPVGYNITKTLYKGSDDSVLWTHTDDIASSWDSGWHELEQSNVGHFKVGAGQTIDIPEVKAFRWLSRALVSDECEVFVGGHVTNTIDGYKPNGLYTGTYWNQIQNNPTTQSTFVHNGENWVDVGTEVTLWASQPNKGHTRRYQGGFWLQEAPFTRN
jgi:hypothetical protein